MYGWVRVPLVAVELQGRSVAFMQSPKPVNIIPEAPFLILSHTTSESVPCPTCLLTFFLPLHLLLPPPPSPLLLFSCIFQCRTLSPRSLPSHTGSSPPAQTPGLLTSPSHGKCRQRVPGGARLLSCHDGSCRATLRAG